LLKIDLRNIKPQFLPAAAEPMAAHPTRWQSGLEELVENASSWPKVGSASHERGHT
jgi:hypothetical protein